MCNSQQNRISKTDFACIGDVAAHCDTNKLCIAINEAQDFDLAQLFGDEWVDVLAIFDEVNDYQTAYAAYLIELAACEADPECTTPPEAPVPPDDYDIKQNLICGGEFTTCNDKTRLHKGVKNMLVYYSYSRYLIINGMSDTAAGTVKKTNEWSLPTPLKELQNFADKYRNMGYESFKQIQDFLCVSRESFTWFDACNCKSCKCGCGCGGQTKAKGYGFKSGNISKTLPGYDYRNVLDENR